MNPVSGFRLIKIAFLTLLSCFLFLLVAWVARTAFLKYKDKSQRISELEIKVADLKRLSHPGWRIHQGRRYIISTEHSDSGAMYGVFKLVSGTNLQKFETALGKEPGHIKIAWVSDWEPRSEMAKFDEFSVTYIPDTTRFEILAKARTNEPITMQFTVSFIVEE